MVAHENPFDERVINYRLRIDRRTRSVALWAMEQTRGVSSPSLDDRQGLFSSNHTLTVQNPKRIYMRFNKTLLKL
jgi:hypothetical protein